MGKRIFRDKENDLSVYYRIVNMNNPFSLAGKKILVTGASSGIGKAIAVECSKMGAIVYLTARNQDRLSETLGMMEGAMHHILVADLSTSDGIQLIVSNINDKLDGVVQCAGFTIPKPFKFFSEDDLSQIMKVNLDAPVILTQNLYAQKKLNKGCSIVLISSINGVYVSYVGSSLYSASKGALNGIAKAMAIELAPSGIRVNCVNPGMVGTHILSKGEKSQEQLDEDAKLYPLKRHGKPEEIAYGVIYLLSDASSWTTGSNLVIDGGYTLL